MSTNETSSTTQQAQANSDNSKKNHKEFKGDPRTLEAFKKILRDNYELMRMHVLVKHQGLARINRFPRPNGVASFTHYSSRSQHQTIWDAPLQGPSAVEVMDIFHLLRSKELSGRNQLPPEMTIPFAEKLMAAAVNNTPHGELLMNFREEALDRLFMRRFAEKPDSIEAPHFLPRPEAHISRLLQHIRLDLPPLVEALVEALDLKYQCDSFRMDFATFFSILHSELKKLSPLPAGIAMPAGVDWLMSDLESLIEDHRNRSHYVADNYFGRDPDQVKEFKSSKDAMLYVIDELGTA